MQAYRYLMRYHYAFYKLRYKRILAAFTKLNKQLFTEFDENVLEI